jgi:thioredoxin-related protein
MKIRTITSAIFLSIPLLLAAQATPESAKSILDKAYKQAAAEKKNVFVIFHASWCGWCRKLEASINDSSCKGFFNKSYIIRELTVMERGDKKTLDNPGALDLYKSYSEEEGIPYFLIFDSKGKLLADSKYVSPNTPAAKPSNMGCPAQDEEITAFIDILKKTSDINEKEVAAIRERFKKNAAPAGH